MQGEFKKRFYALPQAKPWKVSVLFKQFYTIIGAVGIISTLISAYQLKLIHWFQPKGFPIMIITAAALSFIYSLLVQVKQWRERSHLLKTAVAVIEEKEDKINQLNDSVSMWFEKSKKAEDDFALANYVLQQFHPILTQHYYILKNLTLPEEYVNEVAVTLENYNKVKEAAKWKVQK